MKKSLLTRISMNEGKGRCLTQSYDKKPVYQKKNSKTT